MTTILVADDERKITDMLRRTLAYEGYHVITAANGREALAQAWSQRPDIIVLDRMMPDLDGIEVARRIREKGATPILMLTARDTIDDRVEGLDSGADDYLDKPLSYSDLLLDPLTRDVKRGERSFMLSPKEFDLLSYFLRFPRQVLTRERLLQDVWGYDFSGDGNVLEVYVGYLRTKTEVDGEPRLIHTVRGVGYVLREQ